MSYKISTPVDYFALKPFTAAKVSEISELTASASIAANDKANFHIGNPVQNNRLISMYKQLVLGLDPDPTAKVLSTDEIIQSAKISAKKTVLAKLICDSIENCISYLPRGGFSKNKPSDLAKSVHYNLTEKQGEPLEYDMGLKTGKKEISFISGGIYEAMRMLLSGINQNLKNLPAELFVYKFKLPVHISCFDNLKITSLNNDSIYEKIKKSLNDKPNTPHFLVLGKILDESVRRKLYKLSIQKPLFFIECNNAENYFSLAREAGLSDRVIRFLTPDFINKGLKLPVIIIAVGNSDYINLIETIHFEQKGTPSGAELTLSSYIFNDKIKINKSKIVKDANNSISLITDNINSTVSTLLNKSTDHTKKITSIIEHSTEILNKIAKRIDDTSTNIDRMSKDYTFLSKPIVDPFAEQSPINLFCDLINKNNDNEWILNLQNAFISAFLKHHPEYIPQNCLIVSGSARTACGLLGFHCDVKEIITGDLSWTYHHCFPKVHSVTLNEDLSLNVDRIINKLQKILINNNNWRKFGAIVINNPHNATGHIVSDKEMSRLILFVLKNRVRFIDDLSYQNVGPFKKYVHKPTARQLAQKLQEQGYLQQHHLKNIITVHSLSKTDCYAGARLAITEINDPELKDKFARINNFIIPNVTAILTAYLFYRRNIDDINLFWTERNRIMYKRMQTLKKAADQLPLDRNPYKLKVVEPQGSMYPRLVVENLPDGISLDWLAFDLAKQGIGIIPLSTFSKTAKGFEIARKAFRLTLGGMDHSNVLQRKMRRVLIDLNRRIDRLGSRYNRFSLKKSVTNINYHYDIGDFSRIKNKISKTLKKLCEYEFEKQLPIAMTDKNPTRYRSQFLNNYIPDRLNMFYSQLEEHIDIFKSIKFQAENKGQNQIIERLQDELSFESIELRESHFKKRMFDRTVHPTQIYSLSVDMELNNIKQQLLSSNLQTVPDLRKLSDKITAEYFGTNVFINSFHEADEVITDLHSFIEAEMRLEWNYKINLPLMLSFWSDWDGSTRPSGQGHVLAAAVIVENVNRLSNLLNSITKSGTKIKISSNLKDEVNNLPKRNQSFWKLMSKITA